MISIITCSHNQSEDLKLYVSSFIDQNKNALIYELEFIFLENSNSTKIVHVVNKLEQLKYKVQLKFIKNKGFGNACNIGARISKGNVICFINPDIEFKSPLDELIINKNSIKWSTVTQLHKKNIYSFDLMPEIKNIFFEFLFINRFINKFSLLRFFFHKNIYIVGSFLLINKKLFQNIGQFNESFFLYYEETELAKRLINYNIRPHIFKKIQVSHSSLSTMNGKKIKYEIESLINYCKLTNNFRLLKKYKFRYFLLKKFSKVCLERYHILNDYLLNE